MFNNCLFFANIQGDDSVVSSKYDFKNEFFWKQIPKEKVDSLVKYYPTVRLDVDNIDVGKMEVNLEREIKSKVEKFRKDLKLTAYFDNKMSHILAPALTNYELEKLARVTYGSDEFKQAVKHYVPEGFTFKAFPSQGATFDADSVFGLIVSNDVGKDILFTKGDDVRFAVRTKIFQYPCGICSVWTMIAVRYRVIK